eukprot:gene7084-14415_t
MVLQVYPLNMILYFPLLVCVLYLTSLNINAFKEVDPTEISMRTIARWLHLEGKIEEALDLYKQSLDLTPEKLWIYENIADCLDNLKNTSKEEWIELGIKMDTTLQLYDNRNSTGENYTLRTPVMVPGRSAIYYALYITNENIGNFKSAWKYLEIAMNLEERRQNKFIMRLSIEELQKLVSKFTTPFMNQLPQKVSNKEPIFIVGMPHAGHSLLEAMLHQHSRIFGLKVDRSSFNRHILGRIDSDVFYSIFATQMEKKFAVILDSLHPSMTDYDKHLSSIREHLLRDWISTAYASSPEDSRSNLKHILDSNARLYRYIGYIQMLFPNAIIINVLRDPMDTIFGCLRSRNQPIEKLEWTLIGQNVMTIYRDYITMMAYWKDKLPAGRIIDISADELVADPRAVLTPVFEQLELEWEDIVSNVPYEKRLTPKGLWKQYERHLSFEIKSTHDFILAARREGSGPLPLPNLIDWSGKTSYKSVNRTMSSCQQHLINGSAQSTDRDIGIGIPTQREKIPQLISSLGLRTGLIFGISDYRAIASFILKLNDCDHIYLIHAGDDSGGGVTGGGSSSSSSSSSVSVDMNGNVLTDASIEDDSAYNNHERALLRSLKKPKSSSSSSTSTSVMTHTNLTMTFHRGSIYELVKQLDSSSVDFLLIDSEVKDYCTTHSLLHLLCSKVSPGGILTGGNYFYANTQQFHAQYDGPTSNVLHHKSYQVNELSCSVDSRMSYESPRGVKGAVDDFADTQDLDVHVTYLDDPAYFSWILRKPC